MSGRDATERLARRGFGGAFLLAVAAGSARALATSPEHAALAGTGAAAMALLLASLACSPLSTLLSGRWAAAAVALRRCRRWLGLAATGVAAGHASLALTGYLSGLARALEWLTVPWLEHGALALLLLGVLALTSFPAVTRGLRVHAWGPLHRFVYAAAILAALHALLAPFGSVRAGLVGLGLVLASFLARPLAAAAQGVRPSPPGDP